MDYIILALVGLVVGAIVKFIVPGKQGGGIIVTAIPASSGHCLAPLAASNSALSRRRRARTGSRQSSAHRSGVCVQPDHQKSDAG